MYNFLSSLDSLVWGPPLLVLLVGTGIYFSSRLGLLQVFRLPKALKLIFKSEAKGKGDISSYCSCSNCRYWEYCRCRNCHQTWWSRGTSLDVDGRILWNGYKIC